MLWNYTLEYRGGGGGNLLQRVATCSGVGCPGRRSTPEKIARGCRLLRSRLHGVQVTLGCTLLRDRPLLLLHNTVGGEMWADETRAGSIASF